VPLSRLCFVLAFHAYGFGAIAYVTLLSGRRKGLVWTARVLTAVGWLLQGTGLALLLSGQGWRPHGFAEALSILAFLLVALLLAGWAARFIRRPGRWHAPDRRHPVAAEVDLAQRVHSAEIAEGTDDGTEDAGVPTDPAYDLKTSLAELMRDLHRAEVASESARLSEGRDSQDQDTHYQVLQAAE